MVKKILFPLISLFLTYNSIELMKKVLYVFKSTIEWPFELWLAVFFNLYLTGVFAFTGFAYPTSRLLPDNYYKIKDSRRLDLLYNYLGVKYFKSFLLFAFWGKEKNRKKYFDGSKSGLVRFDFQTRQSEFGHLGAFVLVSFAAGLLLYKGFFLGFMATTIINVLFNVYPIVLQRKHRIQIEPLLRRAETFIKMKNT